MKIFLFQVITFSSSHFGLGNETSERRRRDRNCDKCDGPEEFQVSVGRNFFKETVSIVTSKRIKKKKLKVEKKCGVANLTKLNVENGRTAKSLAWKIIS